MAYQVSLNLTAIDALPLSVVSCRSNYFSLLLGIVKLNHGDIIKFCGDAVIIVWSIPWESSLGGATATQALARMAAVCALQVEICLKS